MSKLRGPYHTAIRYSLQAFRSTPTKVLLAESGMPDLFRRVEHNTLKLIGKMFNTTNAVIYKTLINLMKRKTKPRHQSALYRIVAGAKVLQISDRPRLIKVGPYPPWKLPMDSILTSLQQLPKTTTNPTIYKQLFAEIRDHWHNEGWSLIFTDGAKDSKTTSFSVVEENGKLINFGLLHPHASVLTAEGWAILSACKHAAGKYGKFVICSDSKSFLSGVLNPNNSCNMIREVRDILLKHTRKLKLMWVPGHAGISGNEYADKAAKDVILHPTYGFSTSVKADISRTVYAHMKAVFKNDWINFQHWYKRFNPEGVAPLFPPNATKIEIKIFARLRMGHTKITHEHLMSRKSQQQCSTCQCLLTLSHILDVCPALSVGRYSLFGDKKPSDLLSDFTNCHILYSYLKQINMLGVI